MGILTEAITSVLETRIQTERLPAGGGGGMFGGVGTMNLPTGMAAQLNTFMTIPAVFATVDRIANSVAGITWRLYRKTEEGDREELFEHPLLDLWRNPNILDTGESFIEAGSQHAEIVGEWWIIILSNRRGIPAELQIVRPDRMIVVPSREQVVAGYIYRLGQESIPLDRDDVILIKRPNPNDPLRGAGPIQSLMPDIDADRQAALFSSMFYRNGAEPGGILQFDEGLSDEDFEKLVARWQQQHQGVHNAHRVAVIERGKWVDRKITQRDMQFRDNRMFSRDQVMMAFGMPLPILGIVDSVNRANAEAAEVLFTRWIVVPRLRRIRAALNSILIPRYIAAVERVAAGANRLTLPDQVTALLSSELEFDFDDPVPSNRELALQESIQGYNNGVLTLNEARDRLGEGEVDEGDEFKPQSSSNPFGLDLDGTDSPDLVEGPKPLKPRRQYELPVYVKSPETPAQAEELIAENWAKRLRSEVNDINRLIEDLKSFRPQTKIELTDLNGHDWNWWEKYGDEVIEELTQATLLMISTQFDDLPATNIQSIAAAFARERGAQLLRLDGEINLMRITRRRVNELVARTIENGDSLNTLQRLLRDDFAFSPDRARVVARTESATALGQGAKSAAVAAGRDEKRWDTQDDPLVDDDCLANEAQGWIKVEDPFNTGHDTVPAHPSCLPGYSRISAQGISATSKRWYNGDVIIIETAAGHKLTCTPNHPILTTHGWIAAHQLDIGCNVISSMESQWKPAFIDGNHQDMPTTIKKVTDSFAATFEMLPVPTTAEDFHGDGMDGNIAVIRTNRQLLDGRESPADEHFSQVDFGFRNSDMTSLSSDSTIHQFLLRKDSKATSDVSVSDLVIALSGSHSGPFNQLLLRSGALYSTITQEPGNGSAAYPIPLTEELYRIAGQVFADQIIGISREPFSGHVYNLETETGFYVAEGIVTHNCRCTVLYRTSELHSDPIDPESDLEQDVADAIAGSRTVDEILSADIATAIAANKKILCPSCRKRLPVSPMQGVVVGLVWCRGCNQTWDVDTRGQV